MLTLNKCGLTRARGVGVAHACVELSHRGGCCLLLESDSASVGPFLVGGFEVALDALQLYRLSGSTYNLGSRLRDLDLVGADARSSHVVLLVGFAVAQLLLELRFDQVVEQVVGVLQERAITERVVA